MTPSLFLPIRCLRALGVLTCLLVCLAGAHAQAAPAPSPSPRPAPAAAVAAVSQEPAQASSEAEPEGWMPTIAKVVNFATLVGLLVYFLRSPLVTYLRTRGETIRKDLVDAADLRASAERQLSEVRARLAALPAELEALTRRGQDELGAERVRMTDATAREREKLVERTRRDIDVQFRLARRALVTHTAELAMTLARARVEASVTGDDQTRLIDRYAAEVRA